jgi:hypothetical protein
VLPFGLVLGSALGLRATGFLMVGYAGLFILLRAAEMPGLRWRERASFVLAASLRMLPGLGLAYAVMLAAWPWAALDPLNPVRALFAFAHFHYPIGTFVFGQLYDMATVPRWYVPIYLGIKLPLLMLVGTALGLAFAIWSAARRVGERAGRDDELGLLIFVVLFPLLLQVVLRGPAFTGMRHFLFVLPPLAVLAGFGIDRLLTLAARRRLVAVAAAGAVLAAFAWNASMMVRLHPHQYLFFNPIVGGLEGASRRYDTDYWVNIMPEAVDVLEAFRNQGPSPSRSAGSACPSSTKPTVGWNGRRTGSAPTSSSPPRT